jgi:hypothetical protein
MVLNSKLIERHLFKFFKKSTFLLFIKMYKTIYNYLLLVLYCIFFRYFYLKVCFEKY